MTISDDTIKKAVLRYHREYDRYLKLAARVAEICRSEIIEGNAIRAQVTSRAKSPKSLEGKLRRFAATGKKSLPDVDAVFDQIRDLAAVRIATYEQRHEDQVVQLVCNRLVDASGQVPTPAAPTPIIDAMNGSLSLRFRFAWNFTGKYSDSPFPTVKTVGINVATDASANAKSSSVP